MSTISIEVPEQVEQALDRTSEELGRDMRLYAALMLFQLGKLSSGLAAQMADMTRVEFLNLCGEHDISVFQYTPAELAAELDDG